MFFNIIDKRESEIQWLNDVGFTNIARKIRGLVPYLGSFILLYIWGFEVVKICCCCIEYHIKRFLLNSFAILYVFYLWNRVLFQVMKS